MEVYVAALFRMEPRTKLERTVIISDAELLAQQLTQYISYGSFCKHGGLSKQLEIAKFKM